jgi:hypothetical protein
MRRTAIVLVPARTGPFKDIFTITSIYCKICQGVLHNNHQLGVFCYDQNLFAPAIPTLKTPQNTLYQPNLFLTGIFKAFSWLANRSRPGFTVGRVLLLLNDFAPFPKPPIPLTSEFLDHWLQEIVSVIGDKLPEFSFDELQIDLIVISNDQTLDNVVQDDERHVRRRTIVAQPQNCANLGRHLCVQDLRLSTLTIRRLQLFFLDYFNKVDLTVPDQLDVRPRRDLLPPVTASFACCPGEGEQPEMDLRNFVVIFGAVWMLSMIDNKLFLSKLGRPMEREELDQCAFAISGERNELVQKLPPILRVSQGGQNWPFVRTAVSPAMAQLTQLTAADGPDKYLFSHAFFGNQFAIDSFSPILDALGQMQPAAMVVNIATDKVKDLFSRARVNDRALMFGIPHGMPTAAWYDRILSDLGRLITLFSGASEEHARLLHEFEVNKQQFLIATGRSHV